MQPKRFTIVLTLTSAIAILSIIPATSVALADVLTFAVLEIALGLAAFRWWYCPLYSTSFNYFSPLSIVSSLAYLYGGPGNAISFGMREQVSTTNPGAWDYFTIPMLSLVVSLFGFDILYRFVSARIKESPYSYPPREELFGAVTQPAFRVYIILWTVVVVAINVYFGLRYSLVTQGSISGSELDNIINQTRSLLIMIPWAGVSILMATARTRFGRVCAGALYAPMFGYIVTLLSRQYMLRALACIVVAYALSRKSGKISVRITLGALAAAGVLFIVITNYRAEAIFTRQAANGTGSAANNVFASQLDVESTRLYLQRFNQTRISGLEYAAAIQAVHASEGTPWMMGYHNWLVVARSVPRFFWPGKPDTDPEVASNRHFGLTNVDQLSTPISSGFADGGPIGMFLGFAFIAISLCLIQHWLWTLKTGYLIYMGSTVFLMNFENYSVEYATAWIRSLAVILLIDGVLRLVVKPFLRPVGPTAVGVSVVFNSSTPSSRHATAP